MSEELIRRLLAGEYRDPEDGSAVSVPIRRIEIAPSLADREAELVGSLQMGRTLAVVSDVDTEEALGRRLKRGLAGLAGLIPVLLPGRPVPDLATVDELARQTARADALVAVGSGTINDLCKYSAARAGKPYAVFATAPSMNGYTSMNASITVNGLKRTLPARAPAAVFMDLGVLAAAPPRLIRAGFGDSLCRGTAQADWLLAHLLRGDAYRRLPFDLLAREEEKLLGAAAGLLRGDLEAVGSLARTLVLSGLGMSICGGSQPASQGEHLISHWMELRLGECTDGPLHGEQIGVTTLTMARLQERLLGVQRLRVRPGRLTEAGFRRRYGPELGPACFREFLPKRLDAGAAEALNERLAREWPRVREMVAEVCLPPARVRSLLRQVEAPTAAGELGWRGSLYARAVRHAAELRDRYTFLDLARDSGTLDVARLLA